MPSREEILAETVVVATTGEAGGVVVVVAVAVIFGKNAFLDQPPFGHGVDLDHGIGGGRIRAGEAGGSQVAVIDTITHSCAHTGAAHRSH